MYTTSGICILYAICDTILNYAYISPVKSYL